MTTPAAGIAANVVALLAFSGSLIQLQPGSTWFNLLLCVFALWVCASAFLTTKAFRNSYSHDRLYSDIIGIGLDEHMFNLIIVQNRQKKVLTVFDERWNMWLFPHREAITSEEGTEADRAETDAVKEHLSCIAKIGRDRITCSLKHREYTCKYSEADKIQKICYHRFFTVSAEELPDTDEFEISGCRFRWWYLNELETDPKTRKHNAEIVATVKNKVL